MQGGKKLDYQSLVMALLASFRHKNDHLAEFVNILLSYEEFHTASDNNLIRNIYDADHKFQLFEKPDGIRLVSAV